MQCTKDIVAVVLIGVLAAALTIAPAVYSGSRTQRWETSRELKGAAAKLSKLPLRLETWNCVESSPLAESAREILRYEDSFSRTYEKLDKSASLNCIMLVGMPGPLVRHPSEFCYEIRDNITLDQRVLPLQIDGIEHSVRLTRFKEPGAIQREFYVATGWYCDGQLGTSDTPRMTYGSKPYIYAVQVVWQILGDPEDSTITGIEFLQELLPAFQANCLISPRNDNIF